MITIKQARSIGVYVSVIAALVGIVSTCRQIISSPASQTVVVTSADQAEKEELRARIKDLEQQLSALRSATDPALVTAFKTVLLFFLAMSFWWIVVILGLLALAADYYVKPPPTPTALSIFWGFFAHRVFLDWYWSRAGWLGLTLGAVFTALIMVAVDKLSASGPEANAPSSGNGTPVAPQQ